MGLNTTSSEQLSRSVVIVDKIVLKLMTESGNVFPVTPNLIKGETTGLLKSGLSLRADAIDNN